MVEVCIRTCIYGVAEQVKAQAGVSHHPSSDMPWSRQKSKKINAIQGQRRKGHIVRSSAQYPSISALCALTCVHSYLDVDSLSIGPHPAPLLPLTQHSSEMHRCVHTCREWAAENKPTVLNGNIQHHTSLSTTASIAKAVLHTIAECSEFCREGLKHSIM